MVRPPRQEGTSRRAASCPGPAPVECWGAVSSSDQALYHALRMRQLLPEALLAERLRASTTRGVPLEEVLRVSKDIDGAELARAIEVRNRQGRRCVACAETTYLTPKQSSATAKCERCGGALQPRSAPR
jgi:hypothetical protein